MQLEGIDTDLRFDEVGTVLEVSDGVARIYGLENAEANELLEFDNGIKAVVMNLEEDNVGVVLLGPTDRIKEGDTVKRTGRIASIQVGEGMLGRVINPLGETLDGFGLIGGETTEMPLERKAPGVIFRQPVNQPLQTGLKAIDAMIPIGRGQRELIIGDRQTGKTSIAIDTILNQKTNFDAGKPVYCIYVAIGQKGSTVAALVNTLREKGAMDYTIIQKYENLNVENELEKDRINMERDKDASLYDDKCFSDINPMAGTDLAAIKAAIDEYWKSAEPQIIMASDEAECEKLYNQAVEQMYSMGYEELYESQNEKFHKNKEKLGIEFAWPSLQK